MPSLVKPQPLKVIGKRTLRTYGYPPDMEKLATDLVLKQAEMLAHGISKGELAHLPPHPVQPFSLNSIKGRP